MADFKALHNDWKKAKDSVKLVYDGWANANTDYSNAHVEVKNDLPSLPKFKLDLGPSLDDIEKKKNVEKNKTKAEKAVSQYEKEIKSLLREVAKIWFFANFSGWKHWELSPVVRRRTGFVSGSFQSF